MYKMHGKTHIKTISVLSDNRVLTSEQAKHSGDTQHILSEYQIGLHTRGQSSRSGIIELRVLLSYLEHKEARRLNKAKEIQVVKL
jgi:hypothetical protein